jgi:hypothetical protein
MTLAIEPRVATLIRQVVRHEHILLSEFLEQATIAWIRRWRSDWKLEIDGPEGPPKRTRLLIIASNDTDLRRVPKRPRNNTRPRTRSPQ